MRWLVSATLFLVADGRRRVKAVGELEVHPQRMPSHKEASDSGATHQEAQRMPWHPTHEVVCSGRPCRPGEGNLKGYKFWGQPYIHREAYIQSLPRTIPHSPDPPTQSYEALCSMARRIHRHKLVLMAAGDWDFREIVLNWLLHAHRQGYDNALVLAMDRELHADLERRRLPSVDNSANLAAWNMTCLQRHIQRVRAERQLAIAALVSAGYDVLHTDASVVFVHDVLPALRARPELDLIVQREGGLVAAKVGTGVNAGFTLVRAAKRNATVRFLLEVVRRGMVEFYNRWNNVIDQMGWSFLAGERQNWPKGGGGPTTSQLDNETTIITIRRRGCDQLKPSALIHHLTADGSLGPRFEKPVGVRPFRGHRQRLDRYDEMDFDEYRKVMIEIGLWLVDANSQYESGQRIRHA